MEHALLRTPLHDAHIELGAKMVAFGGWHMPIQYAQGILAEHRAVREHVGLFDVSHMGEVDFRGPGAIATVQRLVTNDISRLSDGRAAYTVACREDGGIVDDCIVYRLAGDHLRIVINAANIPKDIAHFRAHIGPDCQLEDRCDDFALIAVQGPEAVELVANMAGGHLRDVPSFGFADGVLAGVPITAARTGYTGEDGFELFIPADRATTVWNALIAAGAPPIGLGARDTLRLEARLCLYGHDIDETTDPISAGLGWVVKLDKADQSQCIGHNALATIRREGPSRALVGFRALERGVVREGAEIVEGDEVVGRVTSGGVAPTVGGSIGMGWIPRRLAGEGHPLTVRQRGRTLAAQQIKGPFYRRK